MTATQGSPPPGGNNDPDATMRKSSDALAQRRWRVSRIRRGVIGGSTAAFVAAWAMIFAQLVTGHDPSLAQSSQATAPAAATASGSSESDSSSGGSYSADPYAEQRSSSESAPSSAPLDPVTTQQS
jgi:hypothetical protein